MDMSIEDYFNEIQEYFKKNIEIPSDSDDIVKELDKDNIMAVVNQDFNAGVSIEECAQKLLKSLQIPKLQTHPQTDIHKEPEQLGGERALNTMERRIMNYSDFLNEEKDWKKYWKKGESYGKYGKVVEFGLEGEGRADVKFDDGEKYTFMFDGKWIEEYKWD